MVFLSGVEGGCRNDLGVDFLEFPAGQQGFATGFGDLAFFSVVALLHKQLDMPLRTIANFSAGLHVLLNAPATSNTMLARYFVNQVDGHW